MRFVTLVGRAFSAVVHEANQICAVYNISILSNIPFSVADTLPPSSLTPRLRPLFTIGVHDIPFLADDFEAFKRRQEGAADLDDESGTGWVACTTDSILAMKDTLWDMLITMPPELSNSSTVKTWPTVEYPRGTTVKATQRDFRRFNALRNGLARLAAQPEVDDGPHPRPQSPVRLSSSHSNRLVKDEGEDGVETLVEPTSWAALAYSGFMWWASAGEQLRSEEQEESSRDASLLADLSSGPHTPMTATATAGQPEIMSESLTSLSDQRQGDDAEARIELAIIAYFHRLTTQMLSMLVEVVDSADAEYAGEYRDSEDGDEQDEGEQLLNGATDSDGSEGPITIDSRAIEVMGLDVWSATDAAFVLDLMATYFGRTARIEGKGVEVCGVRVC